LTLVWSAQATASERDHLRLLLQTQADVTPHIVGLFCPYSRSLFTLVWSAQADATQQLGAVEEQLRSQRQARKQDAKELSLVHSRLKGLEKIHEKERALLACVRQLVLSNKAMEASLCCMACMQLMPEVCMYVSVCVSVRVCVCVCVCVCACVYRYRYTSGISRMQALQESDYIYTYIATLHGFFLKYIIKKIKQNKAMEASLACMACMLLMPEVRQYQ